MSPLRSLSLGTGEETSQESGRISLRNRVGHVKLASVNKTELNESDLIYVEF